MKGKTPETIQSNFLWYPTSPKEALRLIEFIFKFCFNENFGNSSLTSYRGLIYLYF